MPFEPLLAATVTVTFQGLVLFYGSTAMSKSDVIIVNARPNHTPQLVIRGSVSSTINLQEDDQISFPADMGFGATTSSAYDDKTTGVPDLKDYLLRGDLDQKVKDRKTGNDRHGKVFAYVQLPNGTLTPKGYFAHPAKLEKPGNVKELRCLPKSVVLTATSPNDQFDITIKGSNRPSAGKVITVKATDTIVIRNVTNINGNHFNIFEDLLESGGNLGFGQEVTTEHCDGTGNVVSQRRAASLRFRFALLMSRFFSAFKKAPNGDCGPTDYP